MRHAALLTACLALGFGFGCAGDDGPGAPPDLEAGLSVVEDPALVEFWERASTFYGRLARRRFDSIQTFEDGRLRAYFENEVVFSDYYADLASTLVENHFDKNRPTSLEVLEFSLEGPGRARVSTRFEGRDSRPLRRGKVEFERSDRWERVEGEWRIVP